MKRIALVISLLGTVGSALAAGSPLLYKIDFGYGTSNFMLTNPTSESQTVNSISFNYADNDKVLPDLLSKITWGFFNRQDMTVTATQVEGPLYHYTLSFKTPQTIPAGGSEQIGQIPLGDASASAAIPTATTPDYQGLLNHVTVNGDGVTVQGSCSGSVACANPAPNHLLGGYYTDWSVYGAHGNYSLTDLPLPNKSLPVNTLYYDVATIYPAQGSVGLTDGNSDVGLHGGGIAQMAMLRTQYPYLNALLSIGGWGAVNNNSFPSGDLSVLFTYYPEEIPTLAQNLVNTMLQYGFNGIDIDYEWTAPFENRDSVLNGHAPLSVCNGATGYCSPTPLSQAEADGYAELVHDIATDLKTLQANHPDLSSNGYQVNVALFGNDQMMKDLAGFQNAKLDNNDLAIIANNATHIDLMTYDFHGAFDAPVAGSTAGAYNVSGFQSGLKADPADPNVKNSHAPIDQFNLIDSVQNLEKNVPGLDTHKIIIGVPTYARIEKLADNATTATQGQYQPLASIDQQMQSGTPQAGEFEGDYYYQTQAGGANSNPNQWSINGSGTFDYKCIMNANYCYYSSNAGAEPYPSTMKFYNMNGATDNAYSQTPWGYDEASGSFMSFDNYTSAKNKAVYAVQQQLGGVMIWEIDGDLPSNDPSFSTESIMAGVKAGLETVQ